VKRIVDLTAADLRASPVWRYEGGNGPDAIVAPTDRSKLSQADDEVFLAVTDFELYDGSRHTGFCFPADDSGIDYLQPAIVSPDGHVNFWTDGPVAPEELAARWRVLGKQPGEIFPAAFRCLVPVDGRTVSGWIAGVESSRDLTVAIRDVAGGMARADGPAGPAALDRAPTARPVEARREKDAPIDKRTARRRSAEMTVEFTQDSLRGTGIAENISRRGMFVRASHVPTAGPQLRLTVNLPDGRKLVLTGRVVRSADESATGFGLRLADDFPNYDSLFPGSRNRHR